jgi:hypothetical protein
MQEGSRLWITYNFMLRMLSCINDCKKVRSKKYYIFKKSS